MPTQKQFLDNTGLTQLLDELGQYLKGKQDKLTFDTTPTTNSTNPVTSGGIKTALDSISDAVDDIEIPEHLVINEDPTGGSQTIQNAEMLNKIESITATESTASGGTNTVTITETNGNTTSFNILNGTN